MTRKNKMRFIKATYWTGAIADALWAVGLWVPGIFAVLTGEPDFNPSMNMIQVMRIGGVLMGSWSVLLLWGVLKPLERRGILLITAFPAVSGLFLIVVLGMLNGDMENLWLILKTAFLFTIMMISFRFAENIIKKEKTGS